MLLTGCSAVGCLNGDDGVALCSTVPAVLREMRVMSEHAFAQLPIVVVEPGVHTGVPVLIDNPREVGADRIVNSLAAVHLYGGPGIVVDFGTSTTFDAVSVAGRVRRRGAGARDRDLPGRARLREAQLRKVELAAPAVGDRQEHRGGPAVRGVVRLRRPGRRHGGADGEPSCTTTPTRSR